MPDSGIRLTDGSDVLTLIPDHLTVISAGRTTMPNALEGDDTYGVDIALPVANVPLASLAALVVPITLHEQMVFQRWLDGGDLIYNTHYANNAKTYYTRNESTGVMTAWPAGARTAGVKSAWDPILSCYPIAFWDRMGANTFDNIRLFAAIAYCLRDSVNDTEFCAAASAANVGGAVYEYGGEGDGTPTNCIDGIPMTYNPAPPTGTGWGVGGGANLLPDGSVSDSGTVTITLASAKTIDRLTLNWLYDCMPGLNGDANCSITIAFYADGVWHDVLQVSASGDVWGAANNSAYGHWRNVTHIRATMAIHIHNNYGSIQWLQAIVVTGEIAAYGPVSDDDESKLIYTIGNQGVEEINYVVAMKDYNV